MLPCMCVPSGVLMHFQTSPSCSVAHGWKLRWLVPPGWFRLKHLQKNCLQYSSSNALLFLNTRERERERERESGAVHRQEQVSTTSTTTLAGASQKTP